MAGFIVEDTNLGRDGVDMVGEDKDDEMHDGKDVVVVVVDIDAKDAIDKGAVPSDKEEGGDEDEDFECKQDDKERGDKRGEEKSCVNFKEVVGIRGAALS